MNTVEEYTVKVVNPKPIDEGAIRESMYKFMELYAHYPDTLVVSPESYHQLRKNPPNLVFGLTVKVDRDLQDGEWFVQRTESKTKAVK